jgi:hypothetical protein
MYAATWGEVLTKNLAGQDCQNPVFSLDKQSRQAVFPQADSLFPMRWYLPIT